MNATRLTPEKRILWPLLVGLAVPVTLLLVEGGLPAITGLGLFALCIWSGTHPQPLPSRLVQSTAHLGVLLVALGLVLVIAPQRARFGVALSVGTLALAAPRIAWPLEKLNLALVVHFGLISLMGLARTTGRTAYLVAILVFVASMVLTVHGADRGRGQLFGKSARRGDVWPLGLALLCCAGFTSAIGWFLPIAEPMVTEALTPYLGGTANRSGFGTGRIELGDLSEITVDNTIVMRVYGHTDHLRGNVYVDYRSGRWEADSRETELEAIDAVDGTTPLVASGEGQTGARTVRIEAESESGPSVFAPLNATALVSGPAFTELDPFGVLVLAEELRTERRKWTLAIGGEGTRRLLQPTDADRWVPPRLRSDLRKLAVTWVGDAANTSDQLAALERHFRDHFQYTLTFQPTPRGIDPTWHFLTQTREGHCEFFATGFALLARSLGVPTRLVTGYRVLEWNAAGEYYVVRSRDAHAWAEVFVDGKWQTVDPTPPGSLAGAGARTGTFEAYLDLAKRTLGRLFDRLAALSIEQVALALVLIFVLLVVFRKLRSRKAPVPAMSVEVYPALQLLEARLARDDLVRSDSVSLTVFAGRLREAGQAEAADLVEACAALRYGGHGDAQQLSARIRDFVG